MRVTVLYNQSFLDLAIQHTGMVENGFAIAIHNGFAVSDPLPSGMDIEIPDDLEFDMDEVDHYHGNDLQPATGIVDESLVPTGKGIRWMQVGTSFKIS